MYVANYGIHSLGKVHITKAYGVPSILQEDLAFSVINEVAAQFPNIPKEAFSAQYSRPLDILIGSDALSLLPKCTYGPDCKDCRSGLCCYQSKFGLGWVPVGQCKRSSSNKSSCPTSFSICLQRVVPQRLGSLLLRQDL